MIKTLLILAAAMLVTLSGCGTSYPSSTTQETPTRSTHTTQTVQDVEIVSDAPAYESTPNRRVTPRPATPNRMRSRPPRNIRTASPTTFSQKEPREIARHETEFNAKEKNRTNNISRAAKSIDGSIVQPGETFSYNETVGPTNEKRGYKKGIVFLKGEKVEGVGGGVCQVSTTLYQAAENAGLEILERHDHSRPVTYAEEGEEAATSYGGIDFKFKNDETFPVLINASVDKKNGKILTVISEV